MTTLLCLGEILVEMVAEQVDQSSREPGRWIGPFPSGAPAILADQAALCGAAVSLVGTVCISSITAAVVTESVFALPGLGQLVVNGAINRDYTLVLGLVVLTTVCAVLFNLLVDLAYAWLDPRIRY